MQVLPLLSAVATQPAAFSRVYMHDNPRIIQACDEPIVGIWGVAALASTAAPGFHRLEYPETAPHTPIPSYPALASQWMQHCVCSSCMQCTSIPDVQQQEALLRKSQILQGKIWQPMHQHPEPDRVGAGSMPASRCFLHFDPANMAASALASQLANALLTQSCARSLSSRPFQPMGVQRAHLRTACRATLETSASDVSRRSAAAVLAALPALLFSPAGTPNYGRVILGLVWVGAL